MALFFASSLIVFFENKLLTEFDNKFQIYYINPKLYAPSTPNIDLIQWHTQLNVCAVKWLTHAFIHDFHFTFQAYTLTHTLNGMFVSLFKFNTWNLKQF